MKSIALSLLALFVLLSFSNKTPAQDQNIYVCAADLVSNEKPKREGVRSAVSQPSKKWIPGQKIRVRFLNGSQFLQAKVRQYAEVWEQFGNVDFVFVPSGSAEIRVSFGWDASSWSFIGKDSLTNSYVKSANGSRFVNDDSGASMNYGWFNENTSEEDFRRLTLHEFGHALGLHHEHQNRNGNIQWNKEAVIAYFAELGWSKERTQSQILDKYSDSDVTNGVYDRFSIMHYSYPAELIRGGVGIPRNTFLSEGDKRIIAEMYPFDPTVSVKGPDKPQPPVVDRNQPSISFSNIDVNFDGYREDTEEHGMEFSSYFNVTNGLKQDLSIVIYFFKADGKPLLDTNKKYYAVGGQVATYRYFRPDYPTAVYKDLRLFIPYEELEGIQCGDNHLKYTIGIWKGNKRVTSVGATYFTLTVDCED